MDEADPADKCAIELAQRALDELSNGSWKPDIAEYQAALDAARSPGLKARLASLVTHHYFSSNAMAAALVSCETWLAHAPADRSAQDSKLSILVRLRRFDEVIAAARARLVAEPKSFKLHAALANACWQTGDLAAARDHGRVCLELQDRQFGLDHPPPAVPVPRFDPQARERNIIAISLYGADPKYTDGAIRNVRAALHLFPEWTCRIYHDHSVPQPVIAQLALEGAELMTVHNMPAARFGTFWRFLVAEDQAIDRFLVRDCDACLSLRERVLVDEWLASEHHFHVIRDGFTHTDIVLAGMWGAVRGALPAMIPAIRDFCRTAPFSRTADQAFLREWGWQRIRTSVLIHDACFGALGARPFPPRADLPGPRVGQAVNLPPIR